MTFSRYERPARKNSEKVSARAVHVASRTKAEVGERFAQGKHDSRRRRTRSRPGSGDPSDGQLGRILPGRQREFRLDIEQGAARGRRTRQWKSGSFFAAKDLKQWVMILVEDPTSRQPITLRDFEGFGQKFGAIGERLGMNQNYTGVLK